MADSTQNINDNWNAKSDEEKKKTYDNYSQSVNDGEGQGSDDNKSEEEEKQLSALKAMKSVAGGVFGGKLLEGRSLGVQFLIISGGLVVCFVGIYQIIFKCVKEKPLLTVAVILGWVFLVMGIIVSFFLILFKGYCESHGWAARVFSWFSSLPDFCSKMK